MKFSLLSLSTVLLLFLVVPSDGLSQRSDDLEYREFIGANGNKIEAVIVDKSDTGVTLQMKNGQRVEVPFEKLGTEAKEYAKNWSKEKAIFLQKCRSLTVRSVV